MIYANLNIQPRRQPHENPFFHVDDDFLSEKLINTLSIDPYMQSKTYIKMTSRKGLRGYRGIDSDVLFSMHPNCDQTYIIYPLNVKKAALDILDLADLLKKTGKKVEVIRLNHADVGYLQNVYKGKPHKEKRLDYTFPVHIVKTVDVAEMKGTKFLKFRNKINGIKKENILSKELSFSGEEKKLLKDIAGEWGRLRFGDDFEENIIFIFHAIDYLVDAPEVKGIITFQDQKPVGFTIWEKPLKGKNVANAMVHCALYERGLSELLHHEMSQSLYKDGIDYLCLGGAESEGLDAFKRKMNPINSIELVTITL